MVFVRKGRIIIISIMLPEENLSVKGSILFPIFKDREEKFSVLDLGFVCVCVFVHFQIDLNMC